MFVDTHCHLTMLNGVTHKKEAGVLSGDNITSIGFIVDESKKLGIEKIISVAITLQDSVNTIAAAKSFDGVSAAIGIHPCDCCGLWSKDFKEIRVLAKNKRENNVVSIGETGLDFYHKSFFRQRQIDAFKAHIECALENDLPIIVHIRESAQESLKVLEEYKEDIKGVAHCFSQNEDIANVLIGWGFYLGIGGPITYPKNERLRELFKNVLLDKILLETDAPFLPPQEYRGKKNLPQYLPLVAQVIAKIKNIDITDVENQTTKNAENLFSI